MSKLKSCPFCGSENLTTEPAYNESYVRCYNCDADGPVGDYVECERLWNERAKELITNNYTIQNSFCGPITIDLDMVHEIIHDTCACESTTKLKVIFHRNMGTLEVHGPKSLRDDFDNITRQLKH